MELCMLGVDLKVFRAGREAATPPLRESVLGASGAKTSASEAPVGGAGARVTVPGGARRRGRPWVALAASVAFALVSVPAAAQEEEEASEGPTPAELIAPAGADEQGSKLEQAQQQLDELNFTGAQQLLFEVVQSGQATPEQMAQAYFDLGVVEAALDHDVEATDSFYLALMLKPGLLFPAGGSPKIRERLNAARSRVLEVGVLEARALVDGDQLEVHIDNDPLQLVKRVEVVTTGSDDRMSTTKLDRQELSTEVDGSARLLQVVLYDEAGNQLKILEVDPSVKPEVPASEVILDTPSLWGSWGVWAGVAGALALGSTYFIMESSDISAAIDEAQNEPAPDPILIARLEDDRDRVGLYGVVGYSLAGAAAITAGVLLFMNDGGEEQEAGEVTEAAFVPSFGPRHVGAEFSLRF